MFIIYKMLVRVLAKDKEITIQAVDYIKGILVHDQINTLQ